MSKEQELVEIDCKIVRRTDKAVLIDWGKKPDVWIPESQIDSYQRDAGGKITGIAIPEWLATDKGLT